MTGGLDLVNQYNFRGIRQNTDGVSIWPYVDFGFTPYRGDGGLKTVGVNLGTWNAFHSQINDGRFRATGNKWYESDLYATRRLRVRHDGPRVHLYVVHEPGESLRAREGAGGQAVGR